MWNKIWLKNATDVDTWKFAEKVDLANLKSEIDKLDVVKLETFPVDLSKLREVVKNKVVKKTEYNELVKKVNAINTIDTSNLIKKLTMTQKLVKLLLKSLISWRKIIL